MLLNLTYLRVEILLTILNLLGILVSSMMIIAITHLIVPIPAIFIIAINNHPLTFLLASTY